MDDYPALVRTGGRTDGTDNYSPYPTEVGGTTKKTGKKSLKVKYAIFET